MLGKRGDKTGSGQNMDPHLTPEIEPVYPTDSGCKWNLYTQENKEHSCCLKTSRNLIGDVELKNWKQVPLRQKN